MKDPWFDKENIDILDTDSARATATFKKYIEDNLITSAEVNEQVSLLRDKLEKLEGKLDDELHGEVGEVLLQYDVLVEMYRAALAITAKACNLEAEVRES
jgi:hypothetical protein